MPVSILLVQVSPGNENQARGLIDDLDDAEVTESGKGYLVAATDSQTPKEDFELIEKIRRLEHIVDVSLVMTANENQL